MNSQIAAHLNIVESAIKEIQEWANVLWVKFKGGCRFVSKKVVVMEEISVEQAEVAIKAHLRQEIGAGADKVDCSRNARMACKNQPMLQLAVKLCKGLSYKEALNRFSNPSIPRSEEEEKLAKHPMMWLYIQIGCSI